MRISDWSSDVCSSDLLHTCAVLGDSTAQCWGYNHSGQLGNGGNDDSNAPVTVSGLTGATGIAAGAYHTCALLVDGKIGRASCRERVGQEGQVLGCSG